MNMDINDGFNDGLGDGLNDVQNHQNATDNNNGEYSYNSYKSYKQGEYARNHIRITATKLSDGRDFFYLDDSPDYVSGLKTRELKDPRKLAYRFASHIDADGNEVQYAAPQMRQDPLTGDWIPMSTARMNRPITAGPGRLLRAIRLPLANLVLHIKMGKFQTLITMLWFLKIVFHPWFKFLV